MSIRSAEDVRAVFERGRTAAKIFMKNPLTTVSVKGGEIDAIFESQAHLARALGVYRLRVPRRARKAWQARHRKVSPRRCAANAFGGAVFPV
jgi:hypothetical protein